MRTFTTVALTTLCLDKAVAQKKLAIKDLPLAVQKTIQDALKGGEIKNIAKETEKGVTQYEVESVLNGKHRESMWTPGAHCWPSSRKSPSRASRPQHRPRF